MKREVYCLANKNILSKCSSLIIVISINKNVKNCNDFLIVNIELIFKR